MVEGRGALSDFTTCLMYSTYLLTVLGLKPQAHIFWTSGLTARLSTRASGRSPIAGKIHFLMAVLRKKSVCDEFVNEDLRETLG